VVGNASAGGRVKVYKPFVLRFWVKSDVNPLYVGWLMLIGVVVCPW